MLDQFSQGLVGWQILESSLHPRLFQKFFSEVKLMGSVVGISLVGETFADLVTSRSPILLVYPDVLHIKYVFLQRRSSCPTPTQARQQYCTSYSRYASKYSYSCSSLTSTLLLNSQELGVR